MLYQNIRFYFFYGDSWSIFTAYAVKYTFLDLSHRFTLLIVILNIFRLLGALFVLKNRLTVFTVGLMTKVLK